MQAHRGALPHHRIFVLQRLRNAPPVPARPSCWWRTAPSRTRNSSAGRARATTAPLLLVRGTLQVEQKVVNLRGEVFRELKADVGAEGIRWHDFH